MMVFNDTQPIYQQIGNWICDQILSEKWPPNERIPSVRDLGTQLEVNPNTCMRTFDWLQDKEIIFNKRGIGYFVAPNAVSLVRKLKRNEFTHDWLPELFKNMMLLDISPEEIIEEYNNFKAKPVSK